MSPSFNPLPQTWIRDKIRVWRRYVTPVVSSNVSTVTYFSWVTPFTVLGIRCVPRPKETVWGSNGIVTWLDEIFDPHPSSLRYGWTGERCRTG